jgi:hypothetical protein
MATLNALRSPLRLGVLADEVSLPAWVHRLVWQAVSGPIAELALLVLRDPGAPAPRPRQRLAFRAYEQLDRRFFGGRDDHAERVHESPLFASCARRIVTPLRRADGEMLAAEDVAAIRAANLDVLLQLGFGSLKGEVLGAARHGIWEFAHDVAARSGAPPLFWELANAHPVTEVCLLAHDLAGTRVLYRS